MPLLDHFTSPLNRTHPWRSFHGAWAAAMARLLNQGILPSGYYAVPLVDRDGPIEIDVATLRDQEAPEFASGGVELRTWAAPVPALAVAVDLASVDGVEVQVFADDGDPRLAAAVELLSPRTEIGVASTEIGVGTEIGVASVSARPLPLIPHCAARPTLAGLRRPDREPIRPARPARRRCQAGRSDFSSAVPPDRIP